MANISLLGFGHHKEGSPMCIVLPPTSTDGVGVGDPIKNLRLNPNGYYEGSEIGDPDPELTRRRAREDGYNVEEVRSPSRLFDGGPPATGLAGERLRIGVHVPQMRREVPSTPQSVRGGIVVALRNTSKI